MASTDLRFDVQALDRASQAFTRIGQAVERFEKRLDRLDGKTVNTEVGVKTEKAERELGRFATDARRRLNAALSNLPDVEITGDSSDLDKDLARVKGELAELNGKEIGVDLDAEAFDRETRRIRDELARIGRESPSIQVQTDTAAAIAALKLVDAEADRLDGRSVKVKIDVDKSLTDSLIKVAQLGRALGALTLPAAAIAAAPQIASIGAAAVTASGALWLIPAAGAAAGLAVGALALGFSNLGDALGDGEKAAEAFEKLSRNGKELVTTLRGLSPAWTTLRQSVQDAFLEDAGRQVQALATRYMPTLQSVLTAVGGGFNDAGREVSAFLQETATFNDVRITLGNIAAAISEAAQAAAPLTAAFVDIAAVGSETLVDLADGFRASSERFADFIGRARETGQLREWINDGVRALGQLASIAGNAATALGGLFRAATSSGADFLGTVDLITEKISAFINSAQGQDSISSLFRDIREGVQAAAPGAEALAKAVASVVKALGDAGVLKAAGGAFTAVAEAVAPMVEALGGAAPALATLLDIAAALAPVLVPVAVGLAAIKLASAGWQRAKEFPNWLLSVKSGSQEAIRNSDRLSAAMTGLQAPFAAAAGGVRAFRDEMALQKGLAAAQGQDIGRLGAAMAAFETSQVGAVAALRATRDQMRETYASTSQAVQSFADNAGRAANTASVALGDRLADAASKGVEGIIRIPGAVADAARSLNTGLQQAVIRAGLELEALPARAREAGANLRAALGTAAQQAGDRLRELGTAARDTGRLIQTGIGVAVIEAADKIRQLPAAARDAAGTLRTAIGVAAIDAGDRLRTLGTSAADAGRSMAAGLRDGVTNAATALRELPAAAADAGRSLATNLRDGAVTAGTAVRDGMRTAADAVRALPAQLGGAARSAGESVATGLRAIPDGIRTAFSTIGGAVDTGLGHLGRFAGAAGGAAAAAGQAITSGLSRGMSGLLAALGGPWGLLITAATVALGLVAGKQAEAQAAAAEHQGAIDRLADSMDKLTGKATEATRELVAQELTQKKLSDGTTSLASALQTAGISGKDFVDATTGNIPKLEQLNGMLHNQARATLENNGLWKAYKGEIEGAGGSLDLVTDAALGNTAAQQKLNDILKDTGISGQGVTQWATDAVGPLGEVGRLLGAQAGQFADAAAQNAAATAAAQNYTDVLKSLADNKAFEVIKNGGQITEPMRAGFDALAESAGRTAQQAGEAAAKVSGIEGGAAKARSSMEEARKAFIDSATAAGMSAEQAGALADQIGLIPAAAETNFRTNASGVAAELNTLKAQFDAVPGAKQITVSMLSDQAQQQLRDLGFAVTTLPNGQVQVDVKDEAGRLKFDAFITTINTAAAAPKMDLDTSTAQQRADGMKSYVDGLVGIAKADADAAPGTAKADGLKSHIDGITALMKADADITPGTASGDALQGHINGLIGIMTADANNAPGTAKGDAMRAYIQGLIGIMTADANSQPGTAKGAALKAYIDRLVGIMNADARTGAAEAALNNTARPRTAVINVVYNGLQRNIDPSIGGGRITGSGGALVGYAGGGVYAYAGGGLHRASRRSGMVLQGYAPGVDDQNAVLAKGESVLVPELTRLLGARRILAANREASGGRPAAVVGRIASMMDGLIPPTRVARSGAGRFDLTERIPANLVAGLRDVVAVSRGGLPSVNVQGGDMGGVESLLRLLRGDMVAGSQYGPAMVEALGSIVTELRRRGSAAASTQAARAVSAGGAFA